MFKENNLSNGSENLHTNPKTHVSAYNLDDPDDKKGFLEMGRRYLQESEVGCSKPLKMGAQELTLSYLCDNPKMDISVKEIPGKTVLGTFDKGRLKGKEVVLESPPENNDMWVERDFMQLSQNKRSEKENSCRNDEIENNRCEKKAKIEALNLSLAPPDVSLSLTSLNPLQIQNPPKRSLSVPSWVQLNNQSRATSDDIATSLSNSYSHQFSHNPSCSLTRNSTENYEHSIGSRRMENDQIWNCGEGTNGSVHSRFKPIGDSIIYSNHADHNSNLHRTTSSENHSFFPSELPARQKKDTHSANSRGKGLANSRGRGLANSDKTPYQFIQEIVSDSVQVMARVLQEITTDTSDAAKQYLQNLLVEPDKREELVSLQRQLDRRSDLTSETLSKCHKLQLDILVTVKTGIVSYISGETCLATAELVEIFLLLRCKNIKCKSLLPVDDCDCKICSTKKGFCSACMCPICMNFDFASNTCSWVGCDVCSHWFHASCSIQLNLIKPGPSSKGIAGTSEMQFNCLGCEHSSELFGFVKEVFMCCAKDWGLETLMKELQCVRKIFQGSGDFKGKELYDKAEEMLHKLERKRISASDACNGILQFFKYGVSEFSAADNSSKELTEAAPSGPREETRHPPLSTTYNINSSSIRTDTHHTTHQSNKLPLPAEKCLNLEMKFGLPKNDEFDSLETIIRIKEAEARMFQSKADDARTEAEGLKQLVRAKKEKLEEEYAEKFAKLCLQDAEERRRNTLEEVKVLENSHYDYCKMKMRMESEIAGLLERLEVAKQQ